MVGWIILIDRPNDHGSGGGNGELPRQVVASNPGNGNYSNYDASDDRLRTS